MQAQMSVNQAVHFTDWVVGHSHLAMLGFASFAAAGGLVHAWQRIPWARYNPRAIDLAFNLVSAGLVLMVVDLTIAGLVQGRMWASGAPWIESVQSSRPYWAIRAHGASVLVAGGFVALLIGLTTGVRGGGMRAIGVGVASRDEHVSPKVAQVLEKVS
jgi:cbb3-type cytochrome oxidase subunit 1